VVHVAVQIRPIRPSDYRPVISVIDDWWGGRHMADMLPRLFFEHFTDTSFAAERDAELIGFLIGFQSQSRPAEAYIHFVGALVHSAPAQAGSSTRVRKKLSICRTASMKCSKSTGLLTNALACSE
jgi:hypothetical protein